MASLPHKPEMPVEEALGVAGVARILGVHPRTIERHKEKVRGRFVRALEAQREEKLHRIWRELSELFTPENAVAWLKHPVPVLENRRPIDVMAEDGGLDRVIDVIGRMSWGLPA